MVDAKHRARWQESSRLLDELLDLEATRQADRLAQLSREDSELHEIVDQLLHAERQSNHWLEEAEAKPLGLQRLLDNIDLITSDGPTSGGSGAVGKTLGRYQLLERIGSGGMGEVWRSQRIDGVIEQTVAIKILQPLSSATMRARFDLERQILSTLEHPGIARILDAGSDELGTPYLVLEYVQGTPITTHCDSTEASLRTRLSLFLDVCEAVSHAHRSLVVHRDIKPSNVLVESSGKVKLLDFGISKLLRTEGDNAGNPLTRLGLLPMTPDYAAPEQIRGGTITTVTDVYGLGALLYEMLTGGPPFEARGLSPAQLDSLVSNNAPERPSSRRRRNTEDLDGLSWETLRGDLDAIVLKALETNSEDRYDSVTALAQDVRCHLAGHPISARPATTAYFIGKFVRRNRLVLSATGLSVALLTAGVSAFFWQQNESSLRQARFEATSHLLYQLLEQVDPDLHPGNQITALGLLDTASEQLQQFAQGQEARADLARVLGVLYSKNGDSEQGEVWLRRAVQEAEDAKLPTASNTRAQTLSTLGRYLALRGKLSEAQAFLEQSLSAYARAGDESIWPQVAAVDLAQVHYNNGSLTAAATQLQESIALHEPLLQQELADNSQHRNLAAAHELMGRIHTDLGNWSSAATEFAQGLRTCTEHLAENEPSVASLLASQAEMYRRSGQHRQALATFEESIRTYRAAYPNGHGFTATVEARLALFLYRQRELAQAQQYLQSSLAFWRAVPPGTPAEHAEHQQAQALAALLDNESTGAIDAAQRSLLRRREAHGEQPHEAVAASAEFAALVYSVSGDTRKAIDLTTQAQRIREDLFGPLHYSMLATEDMLGRNASSVERP